MSKRPRGPRVRCVRLRDRDGNAGLFGGDDLFTTVVASAAAIFLPSRLRFDDGKNSAPFDAALVLWGASDDEVKCVLAAFAGAWLAAPDVKRHATG